MQKILCWSLVIIITLQQPSLIVRRTRLSTVGDRAFPVAASCVWNDLPQHVMAAESLPVFCSRLFSLGATFRDTLTVVVPGK